MTNLTTPATDVRTLYSHNGMPSDQVMALAIEGYDVFQRKLITPLSDVHIMLFPFDERQIWSGTER